MADFDYNGEQERHPSDFYSTPGWATLALVERVSLDGFTWEPACGDGAMAKLLPGEVFASDLHDRGYGTSGLDFLGPSLPFVHADNVVTNPPFRFAEQFVRRGLDVAQRKVALLLRLQFLESAKRFALFQATPLKQVLVFSRRVSCGLGGEEYTGGKVAYAWFVWEHGYSGKPELDWIP